MDDCCRIAEMLPPPSGDAALTIAILSIVSQLELSVSAVYTANPLSGDGISIDVEYIPSRRLGSSGPGGRGLAAPSGAVVYPRLSEDNIPVDVLYRNREETRVAQAGGIELPRQNDPIQMKSSTQISGARRRRR